MSKKWEIDNIEELSEQEQQEYVEKLKEKCATKKENRKKLWEKIFAGAFLGILGGALMIGLGGDAYNAIGSATIIGSALAEVGITFGAMANVSDIEMEANRQIEEVEKRIQKNKR